MSVKSPGVDLSKQGISGGIPAPVIQTKDNLAKVESVTRLRTLCESQQPGSEPSASPVRLPIRAVRSRSSSLPVGALFQGSRDYPSPQAQVSGSPQAEVAMYLSAAGAAAAMREGDAQRPLIAIDSSALADPPADLVSSCIAEQQSKGATPASASGVKFFIPRPPTTTRQRSFSCSHARDPQLESSKPASQVNKHSLSFFGSRSSELRNYLAREIKEVQVKLDLNDLPTVSPKDVKKFDKAVRKCILTEWKKNVKPEVTDIIIEQLVHEVCAKELKELFCKSNDISFQDLQHTESPRTSELLTIIRKSGFLLVPILKRLQIMYRTLLSIFESKKQKSNWTEELVSLLYRFTFFEDFASSEAARVVEKGKDLEVFLKRFDTFCVSGDSKMRKLIRMAFGDTERMQKNVIATLRKWNDPNMTTVQYVKEMMRKTSWEFSAISNIPYVQHEWEEDSKTLNPIDGETLDQCIRVFVPGSGVGLIPISVDIKKMSGEKPTRNQVFYSSSSSGMYFCDKQMSPPRSISEGEFLEQLFLSLHDAGFAPSINRAQVAAFACFLASKENQTAGTPMSDADMRLLRPFIDLLNATSNTAWTRSYEYVLLMFKPLFAACNTPYWTKVLPEGARYEFNVFDSGECSVTHIRTYCVYPRIRPNSTTPDRDRPLATFPAAWTVRKTSQGWRAVLSVIKQPTFTEHADQKVKNFVHDALINYTDMDHHLDLPKVTGTPRMRTAITPRGDGVLPRLSGGK